MPARRGFREDLSILWLTLIFVPFCFFGPRTRAGLKSLQLFRSLRAPYETSNSTPQRSRLRIGRLRQDAFLEPTLLFDLSLDLCLQTGPEAKPRCRCAAMCRYAFHGIERLGALASASAPSSPGTAQTRSQAEYTSSCMSSHEFQMLLTGRDASFRHVRADAPQSLSLKETRLCLSASTCGSAL